MTAGGKPATSMVGRTAGLHCDAAPRQLLSPPHERFTSQYASLQHGTGSIKHADREDVLCQVDAEGSKLVHDIPLLFRLMDGTSIMALDACDFSVAAGRGSPSHLKNS
jgi:hypothetical protein